MAESSPPVSAPRDLDKRTNITIGDKVFEVEADDLETLGLLGQGAYGIVEKMRHRLTGTIMAVKVRNTYLNIFCFIVVISINFSILANTCYCQHTGAKKAIDRPGCLDENS